MMLLLSLVDVVFRCIEIRCGYPKQIVDEDLEARVHDVIEQVGVEIVQCLPMEYGSIFRPLYSSLFGNWCSSGIGGILEKSSG